MMVVRKAGNLSREKQKDHESMKTASESDGNTGEIRYKQNEAGYKTTSILTLCANLITTMRHLMVLYL